MNDEIVITPAQQCRQYETCNAPICPLDTESQKNGIWYPNEPICTSRRYSQQWLKIQRRIAKKAKNTDRYFTVKNFRVKRVQNPRGTDPDRKQRETINNAACKGDYKVVNKSAGNTTTKKQLLVVAA